MLVLVTLATIPLLVGMVFLALTIAHTRSVKKTDEALIAAMTQNQDVLSELGDALGRLDRAIDGARRTVEYPTRPHNESAASVTKTWLDGIDTASQADEGLESWRDFANSNPAETLTRLESQASYLQDRPSRSKGVQRAKARRVLRAASV